jgi:glycosyltransferase involved in cell wall biosynthesis
VWSSSSYKRLKRFLEEKKPDVVHFHNTFPLISPSAYYACHDLGIPVIQTLDNQRFICPAASFYRDGKLCLDCLNRTPPWPGVLHACYHNSHLHTAVVAAMLSLHRWIGTWQRTVDIFLCSTRFYRDIFVKSGLPASKIVILPHFVWNAHQLNSLQHPQDYALFVGRLDPEKGVKTLLEAWRHLEFPLKIRGSGLLENVAKEFVSKYERKQIEFVGRLEEDKLSDMIRNARFLVVPSEGYYETFGMVIIEAYARGVPVVASNLGVLPELVSDQQTGLLFEAGNAVDLTEKAGWMWDHPNEAITMGKNGLALYESHFTPERCYSNLLGVYERAMNLK